MRARSVWSRLAAMGLVAVVMVLLVRVSGLGSRDTSTAESARVLVYARGADSVRLDPASVADGESAKVIVNVFDTLIGFAEDSSELVPSLATAWEFSADGRRLICQLRPDVRFHDGSPLNAEAVVFTFERLLLPRHPYRPDIVPNEASFDLIERVESAGPLTVVFHLRRPGPVVANLATFSASIVSPTAVRKVGAAAFARHPVGTGPFRFEHWRPDERIVLSANADHWRGRPAADKAVFLSLRDNTVRLAALTRGEADLIDGIDLKDLDVIEAHPELQLHRQPGITVSYLAINARRPPLDDVRVRRAIALAIDKNALNQRAYYGHARPAANILPPTLWGHADDIPADRYDPAAARRLLAEAGFRDGLELGLWVMDYPRPYVPDPRRAGEVLKEMLRDVGIRVRLHSPDWATYLRDVEHARHDLAVLGWSMDTPDPDNFFTNLVHSRTAVVGSANNITFYGVRRGVFLAARPNRAGELDELLDRAAAAGSRTERAELYRRAQRLLFEECPLVSLANTPYLTAGRRGLRGYRLHPTNNVYLRSAEP